MNLHVSSNILSPKRDVDSNSNGKEVAHIRVAYMHDKDLLSEAIISSFREQPIEVDLCPCQA